MRPLQSVRYFVLAAVLVGAGIALFDASKANAAACATPSTDMGTDTLTVAVPAAGTYTIWTRMQAPDTTNNSINLQVDTSNCYNVGGGSFSATSWASNSSNWINYTDGNTANKISVTLTAGNHTLKYIGTKAGVMVDKVILSTDTSCTPTGTGTNCESGDSTPPTVNLGAVTSPVKATVTFTATAADAGGVAKVEFLVNNSVVGSDTSSPYSYAWNSLSVANGTYTVTAKATDNAGNSTTSAGQQITVSNSTSGGASPDINRDGKVNLTDLALLLGRWLQSATPAQGDLNGDGKINLTDLALLLGKWGQSV